MAERSYLWNTNGVGDGPGTGFTSANWEEMFRNLFQNGQEAAGGILINIGQQLAVTVTSGASPALLLGTGAGIVYGHIYINDAPLNFAVTKPTSGTTGGRLVLRTSIGGQTTRAILKMNSDGVAALPALVQSAGTNWEIVVLSFTITTGGTILVTEYGQALRFSTAIGANQIRDLTPSSIMYGLNNGALGSAVGLAWNANFKRLEHDTDFVPSGLGSETLFEQWHAQAASGINDMYMRFLYRRVQAGTTWNSIAMILRRVVDTTVQAFISFYGSNIGINEEAPQYTLDVAGQIRANPPTGVVPIIIGANGVGKTIQGLAADMIASLGVNFIGGDPTIWTSGGSTKFIPGSFRIEVGTFNVSVPANFTTASFSVNFDPVFPTGTRPIVMCTVQTNQGAVPTFFVQSQAVGESNFTGAINTPNPVASNRVITLNWVAFGLRDTP